MSGIRNLLRFSRRAVLAGAVATGVSDLVARSAWRRKHLLLLCYHGVSLRDEHEWDPELFVTPAHLRKRLELIARLGFSVLPLAEALRRCDAGDLPPKSVVLTFDDGLSDFARLAAPILAEFGFPATVYVTTYYMEHQWPVAPPILSYLLWKAGGKILDLSWPDVQSEVGMIRSIESARRFWLSELLRYARARTLSGIERWQLTRELADRLGIAPDLNRVVEDRVLHIMTGDEVRKVALAGFDVQLHTHRHCVPRDRFAFEAELKQNRDRLEALTGRPAEHFCYPSGVVYGECLPWLSEVGVRSAVTCQPGLYNSSSNQYLIPRFIDCAVHSDRVFASWLSGVGAVLRPERSPFATGEDGDALAL